VEEKFQIEIWKRNFKESRLKRKWEIERGKKKRGKHKGGERKGQK